MKRVFILVIAILSFIGVLAGCSGTVNTTVMPNADLNKYKTAYVDLLKEDEFNLGAAIMSHMGGMGFVVKQTPLPNELKDTDLLIKYDYYDGWDFRKYMQRFSVYMYDAKTNAMLLNSRYALTGIWRDEAFRINYTFNDIRRKAGYPLLKDFDDE